MAENKMGRPTVMTDEVVAKLEYGFMRGLNDTEACCYAGISRSAYYDYVKEHEDFIDKKKEWQSRPSTTAKLNIVEAIESGDTDLAKWWLERRNKDEFSLKQEIAADVNEKVTISIELSDD